MEIRSANISEYQEKTMTIKLPFERGGSRDHSGTTLGAIEADPTSWNAFPCISTEMLWKRPGLCRSHDIPSIYDCAKFELDLPTKSRFQEDPKTGPFPVRLINWLSTLILKGLLRLVFQPSSYRISFRDLAEITLLPFERGDSCGHFGTTFNSIDRELA